MASDAVGMWRREPAEPEMAQLRICTVMAHSRYEWLEIAILLKIIAPGRCRPVSVPLESAA